MISTPGGWRAAGELVVGDRVMQSATEYLSDFQWEVVLGGLMGDGALSPTAERSSARFRWGHGAKQAAYGDWKASLFANVTVSRSTNAKGAVFHDVQPSPELAELREAVYVGGKKVLSDDYLKRLTPLSLAVWYMDDGGFTLRSKGVQQRTEGGSGRIGDLCRGVRRRQPGTAPLLSGRHVGHRGEARSQRGQADGDPPVPDGRDGEVPRAHRAVRASVDGVQAAPQVPGSLRLSSRCSPSRGRC